MSLQGDNVKKGGVVEPASRLFDGMGWVLILLQPNGTLAQPGTARCIKSSFYLGLFLECSEVLLVAPTGLNLLLIW